MQKSRSQTWKRIFFSLVPPLLLFVGQANAQDFLTLGARGGLSLNTYSHRFQQAEAFAQFDLPWQWNFYSDWVLNPRMDVSAGYLNSQDTTAFVGTAGPLLELRKGKFPLALEVGASPTILSQYHFGHTDLGEDFQFTSHIGLTWYITDHLSFGYRFQHMSNAGLAKPNPGLNVEMLELSYHF